MKTLALTALTFCSALAPAAHAANREGTVCVSERVADAGYLLKISADLRQASLEEETIAGPRPFAQLDCESLFSPSVPDQINNVLVCRGRDQQANIVVREFVGGFAGLHYASVREEKFENGQPVETEVEFGHLNCK